MLMTRQLLTSYGGSAEVAASASFAVAAHPGWLTRSWDGAETTLFAITGHWN